ncbi:MAG: hypothetical protein EOP88_00960 [Verrucomicrobiaceae bacterium]|nr:MAG: hypothetical protein EOP88_00960 [Verrucomicrobiaceae bacterium]
MKVRTFVLIGLSALLSSCHEEDMPPARQETTRKSEGLPVWVSTVRDNQSQVIGYQPKDGAKRILCLVPPRAGEDGEVYLNQYWTEPGATPLSPEAAETHFKNIEALLETHYGTDGLEDAIQESERLQKLTREEASAKSEDPVIVEKVQAATVISLIKTFRK